MKNIIFTMLFIALAGPAFAQAPPQSDNQKGAMIHKHICDMQKKRPDLPHGHECDDLNQGVSK